MIAQASNLRVIKGGKAVKDRRQLDLPFGEQISALEKNLRLTPVDYINPVNMMSDYGMTFESLKPFRSTPGKTDAEKRVQIIQNYELAGKLYYGLNNMESLDGKYGVSHEILTRMTRTEIAALYIGIGILKGIGAATGGGDREYLKLINTKPEEFEALMNELVKVVHDYHPLRIMMRKERKPAISLAGRMRGITHDSRAKFIASLGLSARNPGQATKFFKYPYEIKNYERDSKPNEKMDMMGIDIYRRQISDFFTKMHELNTQRVLIN